MIKTALKNSINIKKQILEDEMTIQKVKKSADIIIEALSAGNKVFFCGNGGSAADSQHLAGEFIGKLYKERKPLPAIALNTNTSSITAVGNDYEYDDIFSRQILALANQGDVLVGISTSGNSNNVIQAFNSANELGVKTIALTGKTGGQMKDLCDVLINVPSEDTPRIQEVHITLGHIICEAVEQEYVS